MSCLLGLCQISAEKIKKTQTLWKKVSELTQSESLYEPHLRDITRYTQLLHFFSGYARGFYIQLFVYTLYEFCKQIVYIVLMMYTLCRSELMYTKCTQDV